jgi:hypothetical protein
MNWIGGISILALGAIILAVVTDVSLTKCRQGSFYSMIGICTPEHSGK